MSDTASKRARECAGSAPGRRFALAPCGREEGLRIEAADRRIDQLDRMERRQRSAGSAERCGHLHQATGVAARVRVGLRREHTARLLLAELGGRLRLHEVVDARAAAAEILLGRLQDRQARDRAQRSSWLIGEALRMLQVARILEGDSDR